MITINDAIKQIREEEKHLRRQAEQYGTHFLMFKQYYLNRADNLDQLVKWLQDYQAIKGGYKDGQESNDVNKAS